VVSLLVPAGDPVLVAAGDTLFRRRGKKLWAASWFHDGSAQGPAKTGRGNNRVVLAVIVSLPFCARPVALPVLAKLVVKGTNSALRLRYPPRAGRAPAGPYRLGYDLALVTTDLGATPAQVIKRYAARWSIEVAIEDATQEFGAGQARNRTANAVRRTIPFQLPCQTLAMTWYATTGHDPADVEEHRARAPWYRSKSRPSTAGMPGKLRRVLIAARFSASRPDQPTPQEIHAIRLAWEAAAA
jgi:hypothetical protein